MARTVKDGVDVERLTNDREKNPVGKAVREDAPNFPFAMNNSKQFRVISGAMDRVQYLVD
jgi:hypothetical protein